MRQRMFICLAAANLCLVATVAEAALPPFYQSIKELEDILHDPALPQHLQVGYGIDAIEHTSEGWLVTAAKHRVLAKINYQPSDRIGPAAYTIEWIAEPSDTSPAK